MDLYSFDTDILNSLFRKFKIEKYSENESISWHYGDILFGLNGYVLGVGDFKETGGETS